MQDIVDGAPIVLELAGHGWHSFQLFHRPPVSETTAPASGLRISIRSKACKSLSVKLNCSKRGANRKAEQMLDAYAVYYTC